MSWGQSKLSLGSQCDGVKEDQSSFVPRSRMLRGNACTQGAQEVHTILCSPTSACRLWQGWLPQFRLIRGQKRHCRDHSAHCERDGAEPAAAHGTVSPRLGAGGQAAASATAPGSGASLCKLGGAGIVTLRLSKAGLGLVGRWSRLQLCSHLPWRCSRVQHGRCWAGRTEAPCVLQRGQREQHTRGCALLAGGDARAREAALYNCGYP